MLMGMQSVFVMDGEDLPVLPKAHPTAFVEGGNFAPWNVSEIEIIYQVRSILNWGLDD